MNDSESAVTQCRRAYRLTPRGRASRKALAARRANLEKARAAPREVIYGTTRKRRAASRANIQKALAGRRGVISPLLPRAGHEKLRRVIKPSVSRLSPSQAIRN